MTKKEQIKEMVMIIDKGTQTTCALRDKDHKNCGDCEECWTYEISKILYNAGYRKLSKEAQEMVKNALIYSRAKKLSAEEVRKETAKHILSAIDWRVRHTEPCELPYNILIAIRNFAKEYGVKVGQSETICPVCGKDMDGTEHGRQYCEDCKAKFEGKK